MTPPRAAIALLLAAALPAAAQTQAPSFDPRAWKGTQAGPATEVLVLGTVHLAELPDGASPDLSALLERLRGFGPSVIAVEALSGQTCETLSRYRTSYPEMAERFCNDPGAAQRALGLDGPAAEAEIARLLLAWPERPTPGQRRRLAALFLAANDRSSAAVQWLRLPAEERRAGDGVDAPLAELMAGLLRSRNENIQIGAVLAARLGLERVFPTDDHLADAYSASFGAEAEKAILEVWGRPRGEGQTSQEARKKALRAPEEVLAFYREQNRPGLLQEQIAFDFGGNLRHESAGRWGRQYVAAWEARNLHMAANVRTASGNRPGARVLVLVGASHKPYLDAYLDMMHDVRLVDVAAVLK